MKKIVFATLCAFYSMASWASVTIISPEELQVIAIDDQQIKSSFLKSSHNEFQVNAGEHQIYVRYTQFFNEEIGDGHEIVKSGIGIIQTPNLQDGETYRLAVAQSPKNINEAKQFAKQPSVILYNAQNQVLMQHTFEQNSKTWFDGSRFSRSYDLTKNQQKMPSKSITHQSSENKPKTENNKATKNALIELWHKSSPAEQQAFLEWLKPQM